MSLILQGEVYIACQAQLLYTTRLLISSYRRTGQVKDYAKTAVIPLHEWNEIQHLVVLSCDNL